MRGYSIWLSLSSLSRISAKSDLWKRVRGPLRNLFASISSDLVFTTTVNQASSCWLETLGRALISLSIPHDMGDSVAGELVLNRM